MRNSHNFVLVDNASGYIWWAGSDASPEAACAAATLETGGEMAKYREVHNLAANEGGYHVYSAPAGYSVKDGQDRDEIETVSAMPLVGKFAQVTE